MDDARNLRALAHWRVWNGHRIFWRIFLSAGLAFVFALLLLRSNAEDPYRNYVESRKAWLAQAPPSVPDAKNAAIDYGKAFKLFVPTFIGPRNDHPESNLDREGAYFDDPAVLAYLAANAPALTSLDAATQMELCDWKLDYTQLIDPGLNHLGQLRTMSRLLALRARVHAHRSDHRAAAADIRAMYKLADHLRGDRVMLSGLVAVAIRTIAGSVMQAIVIHDAPVRSADIAAYRDAIPDGGDPRSELARVLEGEIAWETVVLDAEASQADEAFNKFSRTYGTSDELLELWTPMYGSERKTLHALMTEVLARVKSGENIPDVKELMMRNVKGPSFIVSSILPGFEHEQDVFLRDADMRRCATAALALLLFRAKNARNPKSLDELVPGYLPVVPVDAFNRKPLAMLVDLNEIEIFHRMNQPEIKLPPGTIRIYSFGQNGVDEGGQYKYSGERQNNKSVLGDDSVFFVPPKK